MRRLKDIYYNPASGFHYVLRGCVEVALNLLKNILCMLKGQDVKFYYLYSYKKTRYVTDATEVQTKK